MRIYTSDQLYKMAKPRLDKDHNSYYTGMDFCPFLLAVKNVPVYVLSVTECYYINGKRRLHVEGQSIIENYVIITKVEGDNIVAASGGALYL